MIAECHSEYVSFRKKPPNCLPSCTFVTRDFVIVQIVQRCVPVSQTGGMARWGWGPESRLWETPGIRWVLSGNTVRSFPCLSPSRPWLWLHGSKGTPLGEGALAGGTVSASGSFGNCISVFFFFQSPQTEREGRDLFSAQFVSVAQCLCSAWECQRGLLGDAFDMFASALPNPPVLPELVSSHRLLGRPGRAPGPLSAK